MISSRIATSTSPKSFAKISRCDAPRYMARFGRENIQPNRSDNIALSMLSNVPGIHFTHANSPRFTQSFRANQNRIGKRAFYMGIRTILSKSEGKWNQWGNMKINKTLKCASNSTHRSVGYRRESSHDDGRDFRRAKIARLAIYMDGRIGYLWRPPSAEIIRPTDAEITTEYESSRFTNGPLRLQLAMLASAVTSECVYPPGCTSDSAS